MGVEIEHDYLGSNFKEEFTIDRVVETGESE